MSLRLSFARHKIALFVLSIVAVASCARKNTRVYCFESLRPPLARRVDLPYLARVRGSYDAIHRQCNLMWEPLLPVAGEGLCLLGYNVYIGTTLKLFGRTPLLQLPAQSHECELAIQSPGMKDPLFGVAPVFHDQQKNEIIGLITVAKFI